MCGIAGVYALPGHVDAAPAMVDAIAHRGPDASGLRLAEYPEGTALGNHRLAILDPRESANQPYRTHGLTLVYNGEVYNFKAVRTDLEAAGFTFSTNSDTEVIAKAWRHWGPASLRRFRGMFAFAILDEQTGHLFLARDPLGIKPLYVARRNGGLAFGSEIKAIRRAMPDLDIDFRGVVASLMYYWIPETHGVFAGVDRLPAGHWAEATPDGGYQVHCYWSAEQELLVDPGPEPDTEQLREILEDSIRAHMVSDVPVATFLSGGLDSSLVTAVAAASAPDIQAYTIAFRDQDQRFEAMPDDAAYAGRFATELGIKLNEIEISPNIVDTLPRMVAMLDEPIGDAAAINTYLICTAAREAGVKVMLSGMGADELFGGYRKHLANLIAARYRRMPESMRRRLVEPAVAALPVAGKRRGYRYSRWAKRFVGFASQDEAASFHGSYSLFGDGELRELVGPELRASVDELVAEHTAVYWSGPADDHVNRMTYTDTQMFLVGLNLTYTDRSSMAASTEVRVPYVDVDVAKAAFAIPGDRKIVGRRGKVPLKEAAGGWVPDEIINRPKGLFSAPLRAWIRRDLTEMVDDLVLGGELVADGVLDDAVIRRMIAADRDGIEDRSKEIWQLLTLETWYRGAKPARVTPH